MGKVVGVVILVAGCAAPQTPAPALAPTPAPAPVVAAAPVEAPKPPPLAIDPYRVDVLPPLGDKHGNPDRGQPVATASQVLLVKVEPGQARVRVRRIDDEIDRNWAVAFIDATGRHVGECKIVAWDASSLECVTSLPLAQMTADVMLEPPTREQQIKRVLLAQAQGDELLVTFAAGTDNDVGDDWNAELVDDRGAAVPKGGCKITRITNAATECRTHAKVDQLYGVLASRDALHE